MNEQELEVKLAKLKEILPDRSDKSLVCEIVGHTRVVSMCFGYVHCARCEEQIGDTLAGAFDNASTVIVGHECDTCVKNYEKLKWHEKYLTPNPFTKEIT